MPAHDVDSEALERFRGYLLIVGRNMIGRLYRARTDAEELVNQTLFEAFEQRAQFHGSSDGELAAWLRQMLTDNIRDAIRYHHRAKRDVDRDQRMAAADSDASFEGLMELTAGITSPSMKAVNHERELQLIQALAQLPADQREAIELHHLQGCTLTTTAETMDRTAASVAGLLRRGLKRLRELLREPNSRQ